MKTHIYLSLKERILEEQPPIFEIPSTSQRRIYKPLEFGWEETEDPSSSSRTPSVSTTTRENTRRNKAQSESEFSTYEDYRHYKISQAKVNALREVVKSWTSMFTIPPDQPFPRQTDIDKIPKKSPLDFYKLNVPPFSGIKEDASKYLEEFIRFNNNYISIPSEKNLINFFVASQTNNYIKAKLSNYVSNESPNNFATVAQYFIANFGTRTIAEQIKFWNNFRLNYNNPNKSKQALDMTVNVLKFTDYDKSAKILSILPENWKYELIDESIIPSETSPMYDELWDSINYKLAKQALIKEYNFIISSRFGGVNRSNYKTEKKNEPNNDKNEKKNKAGYKAYKKENKYKRNESYKSVVYPSKHLTEEDIRKEISQTLENHFTLQTTEIEEVKTPINLSFFTDEIEETKEKKEKIQNEIKTIQQHCQVREIQYTKGVIPILSSLKEKIENNETLAQKYHDEMILPFVEALIMIDSGSNVNLISKKLASILECNIYKVKEELNVTS